MSKSDRIDRYQERRKKESDRRSKDRAKLSELDQELNHVADVFGLPRLKRRRKSQP